MSDTPDRIRAASAHLSSLFTPSSVDSVVPRIATSAHLLGTSLGKAREGVAPLDTLAPMQELDEEQTVGIGVTTAGPALSLSRPSSVSPVRSVKPSGLSRLIAGGRSRENSANAERSVARSPIETDGGLPGKPSASPGDHSGTSAGTIRADADDQEVGERAGLLGAHVRPTYGATSDLSVGSSGQQHAEPETSGPASSSERRLTWKGCRTWAQARVHQAKEMATPSGIKAGLALTATTLPAVVLGMLLNVLDGVSYGVR